jgi:1-aminocyclopropane-1-carboxylate deaminase/D-cysteine desulfhydrase-like pyridoxal-dependent ACC family enzyme
MLSLSLSFFLMLLSSVVHPFSPARLLPLSGGPLSCRSGQLCSSALGSVPCSPSNNDRTVNDLGWLSHLELPSPSPAPSSPALPAPSPISFHSLRSRGFYVKRDDLRKLPCGISGNKSRKFLSLSLLPSQPGGGPLPPLASYGGPQSNSMLALASLAHANDVPFTYYVRPLPRYLRKNRSGNLMRAESLGMRLVELPPAQYEELATATEDGDRGSSSGPSSGPSSPFPTAPFPAPHPGCLFVPQGGASGLSKLGCEHLAEEIVAWWSETAAPEPDGRLAPLAVVLPSGTGSTAYYVHEALAAMCSPSSSSSSSSSSSPAAAAVSVLAVPCVGDRAYLKKQMRSLSGGRSIPTVLGSRAKRAFGKPSPELVETWKELREEADLYVDLLYGASAWAQLLEGFENVGDWASDDGADEPRRRHPLDGRTVLYVHSGGLEGVATQLTRYKHAGLVDDDFDL